MISQGLKENEYNDHDIHKSISYLMNEKSLTDQKSDLKEATEAKIGTIVCQRTI